MSLQFRPTSRSDADSISQLLQLSLRMRPDHPGLGSAQMDWKYWSPHPNWEGSRSFVMEREGKLAAHGAVVPLSLAWRNRRYRLFHLIDWAARPDSPGAGVALLKNAANLSDGVFVAGGSDITQRILPAMGFRESGRATTFVLPLRPFLRLRDDSFSSWKSAARYGRNLLWMMQASSGTPAGWSARRVPRERLATMEFPTPHPRGAEALFERTVPDIYNLLECPATPAEFYLVERGGLARGYFVLAIAVRQSRIAEAWVDSGDIDDWRALYVMAARAAAARRQIAEITTVAGTPVEIDALRQAGFQPRGQIALRFQLRDGGVPEAVRFQLVDGDAAYLHDGATAYWS
jgi:hypothetical protein